MSVFNIGLFSGPRYSAFPWRHNNKISMKGGKIIPIAWDFLNTGEKIDKVDVSNVTRVMPMLAPTLDTYRVDVHAFAVRLRSIGHVSRNPWAYEDFFNLNKNQAGERSLPSLPLGVLLAVNGLRNGTLIESMGFPTFKDLREDYLEYIRRECPYVFEPTIDFQVAYNRSTSPPVRNLLVSGFFPVGMPVMSESVLTDFLELNLSELSRPYALRTAHMTPTSYYLPYCNLNPYSRFPSSVIDLQLPFRGTLVSFIGLKYPEVFGLGTEILVTSFGVVPTGDVSLSPTPAFISELRGTNLLEKVYELYKVDALSVLREYEDWLLDGFLSLSAEGWPDSDSYSAVYGYAESTIFQHIHMLAITNFPDLPTVSLWGIQDRLIPAYPFQAYWKIISDWYINTAINEPDSFFLSKVTDNTLSNFAYYQSEQDFDDLRSRLKEMNTFANRYWNNDYFTSAFPSPQAGQAVGIPVNGTIVDLRNANAMQKLKERLLYAGSRFRDVLFAITGHRTSAAILEMSEVLASWSNTVNVDSVLQQSQSSVNSPLAQYAGTGLGYRSGGKPFSYRADEPTVIMIVASIVPQASYFQGMPRKFLRGNIYDYAIPQLANVGEQKILAAELYFDRDSRPWTDPNRQIFGWTRRNGDWMWTPNEVHGDFRGSLDYWHNSRVFGSVPYLNTSFLEVREEDDNLTRIFAVNSPAVDHFLCRFDFDGQIIRSLPKHVHYDL